MTGVLGAGNIPAPKGQMQSQRQQLAHYDDGVAALKVAKLVPPSLQAAIMMPRTRPVERCTVATDCDRKFRAEHGGGLLTNLEQFRAGRLLAIGHWVGVGANRASGYEHAQ